MQQRRRAREAALKVLYAIDVLGIDVREAINLCWQSFISPEEDIEGVALSKESRDFSSQLVEGSWERRHDIDRLISLCSEHWSISRMSRVDKCILRMAVFELLYCPNIPPKVTLNEAIDLGKTYGSENSGSFINGILDALYLKYCENQEPPEVSQIDEHEISSEKH
jgi:N utilization substance protein B